MTQEKKMNYNTSHISASVPSTTFFHVRDLSALLRDFYCHGVGYVAEEGIDFPEGVEDEHGIFATAFITAREDGAIAMEFTNEESLPRLEIEHVFEEDPARLEQNTDRPFYQDIEMILADHIVEGEVGLLMDPQVFNSIAFTAKGVKHLNMVDLVLQGAEDFLQNQS